jgi:hypothetical protein
MQGPTAAPTSPTRSQIRHPRETDTADAVHQPSHHRAGGGVARPTGRSSSQSWSAIPCLGKRPQSLKLPPVCPSKQKTNKPLTWSPLTESNRRPSPYHE